MLEAFAASFIAIALAEFADKTQLAVLALSSRYSERSDHLRLFAGAFLGFAFADGLAILFGGLVSSYVSVSLIRSFSGLAFIAFGILFLNEKGDGAEKLSNGGSFMVAFSMVALNEFGDKTQLASMVLAARFSQVLPVFLA
jgi:Ca2+/H+ antiporter, TMEM165/GDT1 family